MYEYSFHPKAQIEFENAVTWYAARSTKAALNFAKQIEEKLFVICQHPHQFKNEYRKY